MAEGNFASNRWIYGAAYFGLMMFVMMFYLIPIDVGPYGLPGPDLLICITFVWVLRRPHFVPTPLIALVFMIADMLLMRPLGLWAALVVIGVEFLRSREAVTREQPFPMEWAMVSGVLLALIVTNRIILMIFAVDQAGLGLTLLQFIATFVAYPVIVLTSRIVFGVGKMMPSDNRCERPATMRRKASDTEESARRITRRGPGVGRCTSGLYRRTWLTHAAYAGRTSRSISSFG